MAKKIFGLKAVLMGDPAADGDMGTTLTELLGATVKGSASLIYTEPSTEDIEVEEVDAAFDTLLTQSGKWELNLESYNVSAKTLGDVCGGTYTAGTSGAPDTWEGDDVVFIEKSVECETRNGVKIALPRVKILARPQFNLDKAQLGRLSVKGTGLPPTKAGVKTVKFTDAPAT
ncbi:hypothetical protein [Parapedobacter indicus]|uniref:Uncharacterized protein n=1 Tax=Parapedobacter indicus TaxID=1477437 RepID=A0A1I3V685_9SPHI|nr:hypothetical protein [Parapedobacter indicus]PPK98974.1 hypothetical protein CLV26_1153 [Parapedobacter indicus]SFJ89866.1 hypothetical protein SAMN05444682_115174 [Parapedobacter indicus]